MFRYDGLDSVFRMAYFSFVATGWVRIYLGFLGRDFYFSSFWLEMGGFRYVASWLVCVAIYVGSTRF